MPKNYFLKDMQLTNIYQGLENKLKQLALLRYGLAILFYLLGLAHAILKSFCWLMFFSNPFTFHARQQFKHYF